MAFYDSNALHAQLKSEGYATRVVKPWHVREGDVMILEDSSRPPYLSTLHIPVVVSIVDNYKDFTRPYPYKDAAISHYRFYHKPYTPEDIKYLYNRHSTYGWNRFDDVEIYRKQTPQKG